MQVSRELEKESVVVFDEAHNIDNVCIEALSINLRDATLSAATRNLQQLSNEIQRTKLVRSDSSLLQNMHWAGSGLNSVQHVVHASHSI